MENVTDEPRILESLVEHRQVFPQPWIDRWIIPNPFISPLLGSLRTLGVELADFSFNKEAASVAEAHLTISVRKLNAVVRIGLDSVTFMAGNLDWGIAPNLVPVLEGVSEKIRAIVEAAPNLQQVTLAFHVAPGKSDFRASTAALVNKQLLGEALFYGVSCHGNDSSLMIDKSLKYESEGAAFVRLHRTISGDSRFSDVASLLYNDQLSALRLLGIAGWRDSSG